MKGNLSRNQRQLPHRQSPEATTARKRAVAYLRVSSAEQEREGFSIPAQRKLLHEYAEQAGVQIVHEFVDVETAKKAGRAGFSEMVSFVSKHQCQTILVEKTDRLYRNIKDWVLIDELGLEIHFVKENVVLGSESRSSEKFLHGIKVLMAKNYIDNLSEEVRKGMLEKASQGHWPSFAPVGYLNNLQTRRIEVDPVRAPIIAKVFEWYAAGDASLKEVTRRAAAAGLINQFSGRPLTKAKVHQILHNPLYYGDFVWMGKQYQGLHAPIIPRVLFDRVQEIFQRANRPRYSRHGHPFTGLLTCARCGCAITAELKKGQYLYYHCTGAKGACGNSWIRDVDLLRLLGDVIRGVHIPGEIADRLADALRESQADKERFSRTRLMRLQQQQLQVQAKIDKAYDDRLAGAISEEMWKRRSEEWESEINQVRGDMARLEDASRNYTVTGLRVLELAKSAYLRFNSHDPWEQAKLLKMVLSNCTFDRGSLCPAYNKPFDIFAGGNESGDWLLRLDSNQQPSG
jgi:site-specific DNA recombinase